MSILQQRPKLTVPDALKLAQEAYGLTVTAAPLPSDRDQNFYLISDTGSEFTLKIANATEQKSILTLENEAISYLAHHNIRCPRVCRTISGDAITTVTDDSGTTYFVRLLTYLPGTPLAHVSPHPPELLREIGRFLGKMDHALATFHHPAAHRTLHWDMKQAATVISQHIHHIRTPAQQAIVHHFLSHFQRHILPHLAQLRTSIIHNDGNDHNLLVRNNHIGIIDFGDIVHTHTIFELAISTAYAILNKPDPIQTAVSIIQGYHETYPLTPQEIEWLYSLICIRLCTSVTLSAYQQKQEPDNAYLSISESAAWATLEKLMPVDPQAAYNAFRAACPQPGRTREEIITLRQQHLGPSLSTAYQKPLKIVRGAGAYLYDDTERPYLDLVNNVCHVGHCHPRVVKALQEQAALLNTNTRYLHDHLVTYAQRLTATLPPPLTVCFFVCSGSEANDLALRLAHAHTQAADIIVVDGAYHGNLTSLIEISPYKFNGPGGTGPSPHVHPILMPDPYRGPYKGHTPEVGPAYARHVQQAIQHIQQQGRQPAAFICESLLSCGGQIVLPPGYLQEAYRYIRDAGGLCVADEVQVGFGRVGTHFWGFQTQGVVPDIVTMGKPMGNGHPLAAVVTTPAIAASFNNGMEYFNTFGGNPVSCAVGLAVLDVIAEENLQDNARQIGRYLQTALESLKDAHPIIGDVRGLGLFLGIELVTNRDTLTPAPSTAALIVEQMKERGILLSVDGPLHNVLKIKPPLVLSSDQARTFITTLDEVLTETAQDLPL